MSDNTTEYSILDVLKRCHRHVGNELLDTALDAPCYKETENLVRDIVKAIRKYYEPNFGKDLQNSKL